MKGARVIAVLFGFAALVAALALSAAYVSVSLWGDAARDYLGIAFIVALLISMVSSAVIKFLRWRSRQGDMGATT